MSKNYWVSPTGKVTRVAFSGHCEKSFDIIDEKGWNEEYEKWTLLPCYYSDGSVEFLHEVKKYIRYQDWGTHPGWVLNNTPPTKKQQQRMFEIDNEDE
jgi:hypothetical protein